MIHAAPLLRKWEAGIARISRLPSTCPRHKLYDNFWQPLHLLPRVSAEQMQNIFGFSQTSHRGVRFGICQSLTFRRAFAKGGHSALLSFKYHDVRSRVVGHQCGNDWHREQQCRHRPMIRYVFWPVTAAMAQRCYNQTIKKKFRRRRPTEIQVSSSREVIPGRNAML